MPLVCAIGTNTNLWGRIGCFIVPWGILIVMSEDFLQIHLYFWNYQYQYLYQFHLRIDMQ